MFLSAVNFTPVLQKAVSGLNPVRTGGLRCSHQLNFLNGSPFFGANRFFGLAPPPPSFPFDFGITFWHFKGLELFLGVRY